jgi:hypothetical protein
MYQIGTCAMCSGAVWANAVHICPKVPMRPIASWSQPRTIGERLQTVEEQNREALGILRALKAKYLPDD